VSALGALAAVTLGLAVTAAGLAAWSGSWNFWATPGIPGYGVLPLLLLPAGVMIVSAGVVTLFGDLAEKPLAALVLLPLIVGFFGGALITIPGFILLFLWCPKHVADRLRPRWLPPTWTPPDHSFSTYSRPFLRRELRERRPPGPHWPAVLVDDMPGARTAPRRCGFLAVEGRDLAWYDCTWRTPDCQKSFTVRDAPGINIELRESTPYRFLQAPLAVAVTTNGHQLRFDVFAGVGRPVRKAARAIEARLR